MWTFKEQIAKDIDNVFMNFDEFGEKHVVNGKEMLVIVDNNELIDRERSYQYKNTSYAEGVYIKQMLIYVRASEFGKLPAIGRIIIFDGKNYIVSSAINEDGIYSLSLEANRT